MTCKIVLLQIITFYIKINIVYLSLPVSFVLFCHFYKLIYVKCMGRQGC